MDCVLIENKIIEIIGEYTQIKPANISASSRLVADLRVNSFDLVELVMEFEDEFGIKILDKEIKKMLTVGDLTAMIGKLVK